MPGADIASKLFQMQFLIINLFRGKESDKHTQMPDFLTKDQLKPYTVFVTDDITK